MQNILFFLSYNTTFNNTFIISYYYFNIENIEKLSIEILIF